MGILFVCSSSDTYVRLIFVSLTLMDDGFYMMHCIVCAI